MTFLSALRTAEVRRKLLITAGLLVLFRLGTLLPAPGVLLGNVHACLQAAQVNSGLVGTLNLFSGGALLKLSLFSVGVMPAVTASIVMQMLASIVPPLKRLRRDGGQGKDKITQYGRYLTVLLAVGQGAGLAGLAHARPSPLLPSCPVPLIAGGGIGRTLLLVTAFTGGAVLVMWLGELITAHGAGNGMSLIMFTSIVASIPSQGAAILRVHGAGGLLVMLVVLVTLIAAVVLVESGQRRVPVHYGKQATSGAIGAVSYLPLKIAQAGVTPVIFASSLLALPGMLRQVLPADSGAVAFINAHLMTGTSPMYLISEAVLILLLAFVYVAITFDPLEVADDLQRAGGFIPGVRPGHPTAVHLDGVLSRLVIPGALFLVVMSLIPTAALAFTGSLKSMPLGGTALLIAVGVALETTRKVQAQLLVHDVEGVLD